MQHARDLMEPPVIVAPDLSLVELARVFVDRGVEALCVVEGERLVGVVTGMDLVYREKKVHPPMSVVVLDLVFQLGMRRAESELHKMAATRVDALMTHKVVTATPATPIDELATWMVEQHLSMIPVLEGDRLVGVVTRREMLEVTLSHVLAG
ncbi:MAG: CBS domain-containing protein [Myxococcota bacterium]